MIWGKRTKHAAVLGCGPAGLFAAHGLTQAGYEVSIYSKRRKSELFGAQYLHGQIPGLTDGDDGVKISYSLYGTPAEYRAKVYSDPSAVERVSVESLAPIHQGWDIRLAYDRAWDLYSDRITDVTITPEFLGAIRGNSLPSPSQEFLDFSRLDRVLSSIPLPALCHDRDHRMDSQMVWAIGDAPERGVVCPIDVALPNQVLCDGTTLRGWYRHSNIYGHRTAEWPARRKPPLPNVAQVLKPLRNNCNCFLGIERVGRYGRWEKGILSHHSYVYAAAK